VVPSLQIYKQSPERNRDQLDKPLRSIMLIALLTQQTTVRIDGARSAVERA